MQDGSPPPDASDLSGRLAVAGRTLGEREAAFQGALAEAQTRCKTLRALVAGAIESFHAAASGAGAPHLRVDVGPVRLDEKHVRAMEFDVRRGRHVGLVIVKSKGEVTLVGPFRTGKVEGPCRSFPWDADAEIRKALGDFLEQFLAEAATP
jgi:hypothetical protein